MKRLILTVLVGTVVFASGCDNTPAVKANPTTAGPAGPTPAATVSPPPSMAPSSARLVVPAILFGQNPVQGDLQLYDFWLREGFKAVLQAQAVGRGYTSGKGTLAVAVAAVKNGSERIVNDAIAKTPTDAQLSDARISLQAHGDWS
jgi:hypothetical protein